MSVDIHFCTDDEIGLVMGFLHRHWAADHVLSWHRALMDFQHKDTARGRYNYVVARRISDGELISVLGFIPSRLYDEDLASRNVIMLALWKTLPDAGIAGLGLRLLRYLGDNEPHVAMAVAGINKDHPNMYRALGYFSDEYQQHYLRNWRVTETLLGKFPDQPVASRPPTGAATLEPLSRAAFFEATAAVSAAAPERSRLLPAKSPRYLFRRFMDHPVYKYDVNLVRLGGRPAGVLVSRLAGHEGAQALRIVDFLGEETTLGQIGGALDGLLESSGAEYADLWSYGIATDTLARAGLRRLDPDGATIVPNFFEPFTPKNGRIRFAFRSPDAAPFVLFRADGDQDRPNKVARP